MAPVMPRDWENGRYDRGHPYAWRTWLRGHLPWFLINLGVADKGRDCEAKGARHRWYSQDHENSACHHCRVVRPGRLWETREAPRDDRRGSPGIRRP
jgi:hypothetical protein